MVRGRRLPGAQAAVRWLASDARDVTCIHGSSAGPAVAVQADVSVATVAGGLKRWQRRVERRRLLALGRRSALAGLGAACVLQLGALASGSDGSGLWLVPAGLVAAVAAAIGLAHRTSPAAAARLLDRDLLLGAGVSTALELETSVQRATGRRGLGALVVADVRGTLGRSLTGAGARLQPRHREAALLTALVPVLALLLVVPSPRSATAGVAASALPASSDNRALRAENGLSRGADADAGASVRAFAQTPVDAPPLAAVQPDGATRSGGTAPGRSRYDGSRPNDAQVGAVDPSSPTTGQGGAVAPADTTAGSSSSPGERTASSSPNSPDSTGGSPDGSAGGQAKPYAGAKPNGATGDAGDAASGRASELGPAPEGQRAPQGQSSPGGEVGKPGGKAQGGNDAPSPGTAKGGKPERSAPGSAAAGNAAGAKSAGKGKGVVPQLRGGTVLPLAPTYEAVPGVAGARAGKQSPAAGGAGGAGRSDQAKGGATGTGGAAGVAWVPPGGAAVASSDRGVVRGYFGSFARVNSSGW